MFKKLIFSHDVDFSMELVIAVMKKVVVYVGSKQNQQCYDGLVP